MYTVQLHFAPDLVLYSKRGLEIQEPKLDSRRVWNKMLRVFVDDMLCESLRADFLISTFFYDIHDEILINLGF